VRPPVRQTDHRPHAQAIRDFLARVTYKPGWTFELEPPLFSPDAYVIRVSAQVRAVDPPHDAVTLTRLESVDGAWLSRGPEDRDRALSFAVECCVRTLEAHESEEWLRLDGRPITALTHG